MFGNNPWVRRPSRRSDRILHLPHAFEDSGQQPENARRRPPLGHHDVRHVATITLRHHSGGVRGIRLLIATLEVLFA
jgi:hypothetical protein